MKNNISLIGMPAVGKSTIGVVLAKALGYDFLDTDILIQNKYNLKLFEIIEKFGVEKFIEIEDNFISNLTTKKSVIATGGSAIYGENAMRNLKNISKVIYLENDLDIIKSRIGDLNTRGVIKKQANSLSSLYNERVSYYTNYADIKINVKNKQINQIVDDILKLL